MKKLTLISILMAGVFYSAFSQSECTSRRYIDTIFHSVKTTNNVYFGSADPYLSTTSQDLYFDVYEPANDTVSIRPVIVYQFGGGFVIGWREEPDIPQFATYFAQLGYVVVTIDYRIGLNPTDSLSGVRAFYRGVQDERAALRYLSQNATLFGIDTSRIILTGTSAGCFCGFANTYMSDADWPACIHGLPLDQVDLGCMDCSGNNLFGHRIPKLLAMINMWGAVLDTNLITVPKSIPLVSFQGDQDVLVPYTYGYPFTLPVFPKVYGGLPIHQRMSNLGLLQEWHPLIGYGHEPELTAPWLNDTIYNYSRKFLYPLLLPRTSPIAGDSIVCKGARAHYAVNYTPGSWYCWKISGNGTIIQNDSNTLTVIWHDTGTVSVSVTEMNDIDAQGTPESFQTLVKGHSQPAFTTSANQLQVSFINSSQGAASDYWTFGNQDMSTSINPIENYTSPGNYTIWLYTSNGYCTDSVKKTIGIDSCPVAHFTYQTTNMNAFFYGDTTNTNTYIWHYGDGDSASVGASHVFHQYQHNGTYTVILTVENKLGCISSDTVEVTFTGTGVGNVSNDEVSVVCNLTTGCEIKLSKLGRWTLQVYDMLGRRLSTAEITGDYIVETSMLPTGVYLLKLDNGNQGISRKFVKQ